MRTLRQLVRNGHARIDKPTLPNSSSLRAAQRKEQYEELGADLRMRYTNEAIYCLTKSSLVTEYIERQQVKFVAHIARQPNSRATKRLIFDASQYRKSGGSVKTLLQQANQYTPNTRSTNSWLLHAGVNFSYSHSARIDSIMDPQLDPMVKTID